jgi:hypothetical protein
VTACFNNTPTPEGTNASQAGVDTNSTKGTLQALFSAALSFFTDIFTPANDAVGG